MRLVLYHMYVQYTTEDWIHRKLQTLVGCQILPETSSRSRLSVMCMQGLGSGLVELICHKLHSLPLDVQRLRRRWLSQRTTQQNDILPLTYKALQ